MEMKIGKLPPALLDKLIFKRLGGMAVHRPEVVAGPGPGEDCAVIDVGQEYCVLTADPITAAPSRAGFFALRVNANDVAACGCEPLGALLTLLLPPAWAEEDLDVLMEEVCREAEKLHVAILGGHTEITDAVNRLVVCVTMVGKTHNRRFIATGGAKPGQALVMTKTAGLEGTLILAPATPWPAEAVSVADEAAIAAAQGATALHDATEGGVLGACYELAEASAVGVEIDADSIPVAEATQALCRRLGLDPLRLISSGALLAAVDDGPALVAALGLAGIPASVIGKITAPPRRVWRRGGAEFALEPPEADAVYSELS
jgi:hydrogenase maturation factor